MMPKLLSFQETVKSFLTRPGRHVLLTPSGVGMDRTVVAALGEVPGTKLLIDSRMIHDQWKRICNEFGVVVDIVTPEKITKDYQNGLIHQYDTVVWNVTNRGSIMLEALASTANQADNVWVRRIDPLVPKGANLLKGFTGPFDIYCLMDSETDIYPVRHTNWKYLEKVLKYLKGKE